MYQHRSVRSPLEGPVYPVEEVLRLARGWFIQLTKKASNEAAIYLGDESVSLLYQIRDVLLELSREEWSFSQENENGWVDVYRVEVFENWPAVWIKLKIERLSGYQEVVVLSFHEYRDD